MHFFEIIKLQFQCCTLCILELLFLNTKEIKNAPSALLSYISTRKFLRTREKCRLASLHFSSVLKNSRVLI